MHLFNLLAKTALSYPDNYAVIHHQQKITYRNLTQSVIKLATYLEQINLNKGARIALLFENSIEYVISFFAVLKADYVAVPLDTSLTAQDIIDIINDCQPEVLILVLSTILCKFT